MKATTLILLLTLVLCACAPAAPTPTATPIPPTAVPAPDPKALAAELDAIAQKSHAAGEFDGAILVARNGQVILSQGYGFADRENKILITPQTKFRLASIGKQFTAMAIMLLQARGKLNVKDKLCAYVPNCPENWKPIALHHLLTHSSGLPGTIRWLASPEEMVADAKNKSLLFQPGEKFSYSDVGFDLLGKIIEKVSGQSYEVFLKQNIFEPLQMTGTGYDHLEADIAKGYSKGEGTQALAPMYPGGLYAAGAIYSTVEDLYRYDQALYTDKLLPQAERSAMLTPQMPIPDNEYYGPFYGGTGWGYGYGWFIRPGESRLILHGGTATGVRTEFRRYPDDKITIIQLCNQEAVMLGPVGNAIAEKLLGK